VRLEQLEDRTTPTIHTWTGASPTPNWSVAANWSDGTTPVYDDSVVFNTATTSYQTLPGNLTVDVLTFNPGADATLVLNQNLAIDGTGTNDLNDETGANDITGDADLFLASATVEIVTDSTPGRLRIAADISGPAGFNKFGPGTLELAADSTLPGHSGNTYAGVTTIGEGKLRLLTNTTDDGLSATIFVGDTLGPANSAQLILLGTYEIPDAASVTVRSDGLLDVEPGAIEDVGSLTVQAGGRFAPGMTAGVAPFRVSGAVTLQGVLDPVGPSMSAIGQEFVIIQKGGTAPVSGSFAGLPEGGGLIVGGSPFSISYRGGDGNDVVLTRLAELPDTHVAVSGTADGAARVYLSDVTGHYTAAPVTVAAFGVLGASVRATTADVNGDTRVDTILVTGPGVPLRMAVVSGADNTTLLVPPTAPFAGSEGFTGGGFVAAADLDGDGAAEWVVTPDQGGGPRVTVFRYGGGWLAATANFFGIDDPAFRGGCRAAAGDVNGDHVPDLVVAAGFLGGPRVAVFNGATVTGTPTRLVNDFFAFTGSDAVNLRNGAFVAVGDVNRDGYADLVFGGGPGGAPRVFILPGSLVAAGNVAAAQAAPVANFFVAGNSADRGGVRVAVDDADCDGRADVLAGSGEGLAARVRSYLGVNFTTAAEPATFQDLTVLGGVVLAGGVYVG
jgi:hypothetical protein